MSKSICSRREFFKISGQATKMALTLNFLVLAVGCATIDPNNDWSQVAPEEFDYKAYNKWYIQNRLYNARNPNVGQNQHSRFRDNFNQGWTPGIGYHTGDMIAMAPGIVFEIDTLNSNMGQGNLLSFCSSRHFLSSGTTPAPFSRL